MTPRHKLSRLCSALHLAYGDMRPLSELSLATTTGAVWVARVVELRQFWGKA